MHRDSWYRKRKIFFESFKVLNAAFYVNFEYLGQKMGGAMKKVSIRHNYFFLFSDGGDKEKMECFVDFCEASLKNIINIYFYFKNDLSFLFLGCYF
jgi:hypothetical protein